MSASDTGYRAEALIGQDIAAYLKAHEEKTMLRFITCGSVDDGKSTLIGRLLYDSKMIFDDQLSALEAASKKSGTQGDAIDFALLVDGLAAEREQGITIDVAYRFFATEKRKFIVADTPGHEQYTRNMVTGASTADLAVLLVDARQGVLTQTRRHAYLVHLLGIKHIVLAVNKMDLVDFSEICFQDIVDDFNSFAADLNMAPPLAISSFVRTSRTAMTASASQHTRSTRGSPGCASMPASTSSTSAASATSSCSRPAGRRWSAPVAGPGPSTRSSSWAPTRCPIASSGSS